MWVFVQALIPVAGEPANADVLDIFLAALPWPTVLSGCETGLSGRLGAILQSLSFRLTHQKGQAMVISVVDYLSQTDALATDRLSPA